MKIRLLIFLAAIQALPLYAADKVKQNDKIPEWIATEFRKKCSFTDTLLLVSGSYAEKGQIDWAGICNHEGQSSIIIFWGGPNQCSSIVAPQLESSFLREIPDMDGVENVRSIERAAPAEVSGNHDGLKDIAEDIVMTGWYCTERRWRPVVLRPKTDKLKQ